MLLLHLAVAAIGAGQAFTCTPVSVWDGDGPIWCAEGPRIRLRGIAARELDETCRRGHPCPAAGGREARDALVQLLGGPRGRTRDGHILVSGPALACRSFGPDAYGRTVASCAGAGGDLSCALLRRRMVARWGRFDGSGGCG